MPDHGRPAERGGAKDRHAGAERREERQDGGQRRYAQTKGENERDGAIGADPAVLHDLERRVAVAAAAKAIGRIAEPILMQRTGQQRLESDDDEGGKKRTDLQRVHRAGRGSGG